MNTLFVYWLSLPGTCWLDSPENSAFVFSVLDMKHAYNYTDILQCEKIGVAQFRNYVYCN